MAAPNTKAFFEFPQTRWSVFGMSLPGNAAGSETCREHFCQYYWNPLYAYARARGQSAADAQDLTQAFVIHFLEKGGLEVASPQRGTFRSYLRTSFRNFMTAQWRRSSAEKRGGPKGACSMNAESAVAQVLADPSATPDLLFDRCWAQAHIDASLEALATLQSHRGLGEDFAILRPFLTGDGHGSSLRDAAAQLGVRYEAARRRLTRLRVDFRRLLREEVANTLGPDEDLDSELRYLISCLR